jgi:DNA topoisomerase I
MGKALIIVESPTKIKTLKKFLGSKFLFESSLGHVRDLPAKGFGIDVAHDLEPQYEILPDKKEVIARLKKAAKEADVVYLSPDPDREGEAIAWHIAAVLPQGTPIQRVTFNEITKDAVLDALKHPREIDQALVDAQQARRLLDRIVGYKISPILMRRVQGDRDGGLSAGRVQSVALKLIVDREKEIESFQAVEYWSLEALLKAAASTFKAHLYSVDGKKIEKEKAEGKDFFLIPNEETALSLKKRLERAKYWVTSVEKKEKRRHPVAPFITSTLQQEASRHFGFSASRTMGIAQSLYEGIDLGQEGSEGLITYMRTDSVRIAPEAVTAARRYVTEHFGKEYIPDTARHFASKKSAQDAHEAIRPTQVERTPDQIKKYLSSDQYKLYLLIWRRFLACQMNPAIYDTVSCAIETDQDLVLRASGSVIKFPGFLAIYEEKKDRQDDEGREEKLPPLEEGQPLDLKEVLAEQSFTKPPARFTEASLVRELERLGIGRPSTYAAIMNKIQSRDYTTKERLTLKPTELGKVIAQMLENSFKLIMDVGFTAAMEDELESIAAREKKWKEVLREFWDHFIPTVDIAEKEAFVPKILTDIDCPKCSKKLQKIWSRRKYFYGCSDYPNCDFTAPLEALEFKKEDYAADFDWEQKCPQCQSLMHIRHGRFGPFLGCSRYPECRGIVNIPPKGESAQAETTPCPAIGCEGHMRQRRSRFGKPFFSCSTYPECDVIVNHLEDLTTKYPNHPKTPYEKKSSKKISKQSPKTPKKSPKKTTSKKELLYKPSSSLSAIIGADPISRTQATKKIWEYIKKQNLQDPKNKRLIVPDALFSKLMKDHKPLDMMRLPSLLSQHLQKE